MTAHVRIVCVLAGLVASSTGMLGQPAVSPLNWGERALVVVPMVGSGTGEDPRRPLIAPAPGSGLPEGIVSIRFEESDDGKSALVEIVARDRKSLDAALAPAASRADVRRFDKGRSPKEEVEAFFRGRKRGFDLDRFVLMGDEGRRAAAAAGAR